MPVLLGLSGSLRQHSFSTAILRAIGDALGDKADFRLLTLHDVPLYDQDADTETPPPGVDQLRKAIGAADGIVLASPEYNHGTPGVLKNALDWASRPYGHATLIGKPVFTVTSSPGTAGGARGREQINETLALIGARVLLHPKAVVPSVQTKISGGVLTDRATLDFLLRGVEDLLTEIGRPTDTVPVQA